MSAFVVDKETIDLIVAAAGHLFGKPDADLSLDLDRLGQDLWDENIASVSYRYSRAGRVPYYGEEHAEQLPDCGSFDLPGTYVHEQIAPGIELEVPEWLNPYAHTSTEITREALEEAIRSYTYQSCEHPQWEGSFPADLCGVLKQMLCEFPQAPAAPEPEIPGPDLLALYGDLSRAETIKRIRQALRRRSGKAWSVTGGRGTGWGWIRITAPPARCVGWGHMTDEDAGELAQLLGKGRVHQQGESIPSSSDYYREYIDRAEGREPRTFGTQYWD